MYLPDVVLITTVSYGYEIWGTFSASKLSSELEGMADLQLAFFCQICQRRNSVSAHIVFAGRNPVAPRLAVSSSGLCTQAGWIA